MHLRFYSSRMIAIFFFQLVMFQQQHIFKVLSKIIIITTITHPTCAAIFQMTYFAFSFVFKKFLFLITTLILWYLYSVVILIPSHLILHIFTNFVVHEPILILELRVFCLFNFTEKHCNYKSMFKSIVNLVNTETNLQLYKKFRFRQESLCK